MVKSRIDHQYYVGKIFKNSKGQEYKILSYEGCKNKKHMYYVQFVDTKNKYLTTRDKAILRKTVKDETYEKLQKKQKALEKTKKRKAMNKIKRTEKIFVDNKDSLTIMSVDQATKHAGYSIFKCGIVIEYGLLSSNERDTDMRIFEIQQEIIKIMKKHNVDIVVFEDIYLSFNAVTYKQLAKLQGVLINTAINLDTQYVIVSAVEWKKKYDLLKKKSSRDSQKKNGKYYVKKYLNIKVETDDVSDAILMGKYVYDEVLSSGFTF